MSQLAQNRGTLSNQNICRDTNVLIWKSTPVCASCDIIFVNRKLVFHRLDVFIFFRIMKMLTVVPRVYDLGELPL